MSGPELASVLGPEGLGPVGAASSCTRAPRRARSDSPASVAPEWGLEQLQGSFPSASDPLGGTGRGPSQGVRGWGSRSRPEGLFHFEVWAGTRLPRAACGCGLPSWGLWGVRAGRAGAGWRGKAGRGPWCAQSRGAALSDGVCPPALWESCSLGHTWLLGPGPPLCPWTTSLSVFPLHLRVVMTGL